MLDPLAANTNTDDKPDPNIEGIELRGAFILVRPVEITNKIGSILLPDENVDTFRQLLCLGKVLAVSPVAHDPDIQGPNPIEVGTHVLYEKLKTGRKVKLDGVEVLFMSADGILATVTDTQSFSLHNLQVKN